MHQGMGQPVTLNARVVVRDRHLHNECSIVDIHHPVAVGVGDLGVQPLALGGNELRIGARDPAVAIRIPARPCWTVQRSAA
jgi:hypothetical protein